MVDTSDLKSDAARLAGSSPAWATTRNNRTIRVISLTIQ